MGGKKSRFSLIYFRRRVVLFALGVFEITLFNACCSLGVFFWSAARTSHSKGAGGILNRNCCPRLRPLVAGEKRGSDGIQEKCRGEPVGVREGGEGGGSWI